MADLGLPSGEELQFGEARNTLDSYRRMFETQIATLPRDLSPEDLAALAGQFKTLPAVRDAMISIYRANRRHQVDIAFPQVARRFFVVAVVSAMEEHAHAFSNALREQKALPLRWTDLRGNTLDRLHAYAFKLAGLKPPPAELWERARWLEQIRDCIVHANGDVARSRDTKSLRGMAGKFDGYEVDARGHIVLHEAGGRHALNVFATLFMILYQQARLPGTTLPRS